MRSWPGINVYNVLHPYFAVTVKGMGILNSKAVNDVNRQSSFLFYFPQGGLNTTFRPLHMPFGKSAETFEGAYDL